MLNSEDVKIILKFFFNILLVGSDRSADNIVIILSEYCPTERGDRILISIPQLNV